MFSERNQNQIIRKDAKDCFVESLSDSFDINKVHLVFASYDLNKPVGERQTNNIHIYIDIPEFITLCQKVENGDLRRIVKFKKEKQDKSPVAEWLGGVSAEKLALSGKSRADGKCLSRVGKLLVGAKSDFMLVADSGPGDQTEQGLIVPCFVKNAEQHVLVGLSWDDLSELLLMTKIHYEAWLTSCYMLKRKGYK